MRIGVDARMYGPKIATGIGAYIKNLTDELFSLDQENEYFLFLRDPAYAEYIPPSPKIKKVKVNCPWYSLSEQLLMPLILLKYRLDLVHFPHFNAAVFYPKKFIITVHDITPKFFPGPKAKKSFIRRWGYRLVFALSLARAKKIISVSEHTKDNLVKHFKIPAKKIEVIHLGIDSSFKETDDPLRISTIKEIYEITKPYLFYLGVWRDHKNLPGLISAFNLLKEKSDFDYQLVLAGQPDPRYPEIEQAIRASPYKNDVNRPGFVPQGDLPALYSAASLFVLPSFCEGFGLVAVEALACGCPVAASKTTSLPEILGEAGIYFDPHNPAAMAETIERVLIDSNLRQELKTKGLKKAAGYRWPDTAKKVLALYRSI